MEEVCKIYERGKNKRRKARATPPEGGWNSPRLPAARAALSPGPGCGGGGHRRWESGCHVRAGHPHAHADTCSVACRALLGSKGLSGEFLLPSLISVGLLISSLKNLSQQDHSKNSVKLNYSNASYIFLASETLKRTSVCLPQSLKENVSL